MAEIGRAFDMEVIAWSHNLTAESAAEVGVERVEKDELFRRADFLTIHYKLGERSRGLVGARELGLMKKHGLPGEHLARADRRHRRADRGAGARARSPAPGSTSTTRSRCPRTIRCATCRARC